MSQQQSQQAQEEGRKNQICISCSQMIDPRDLASMQCGHPFHYQCLQVSLGEQIRRQEYPLCCPIPQCFVEPSMYFMSVVLEEPDFQEYLLLEKNSVQSFEIYECSFCDQSFLAFPSNKVHKCLKCYNVICLNCSQLAHPNKPCPAQSEKKKQQLVPSQPVIPIQPPITIQPQSTHSRHNSYTSAQQISQNPYQLQPQNPIQYSSQTSRKCSPPRDGSKNVPLRSLSLKSKEAALNQGAGDSAMIALASQTTSRKDTEEHRSNSIGIQNATNKKSSQHTQQHFNIQAPQHMAQQRKFSATAAPSPTTQLSHKKNSLSSVQGQNDKNINYIQKNRDSNSQTQIKHSSSISSTSITAKVSHNHSNSNNSNAKSSRKSFDKGAPVILHASSEDVNKILNQTAALLKMQTNIMFQNKPSS